jgi:hypothetical protein
LGAFGVAKLIGFTVFMYLLHWSGDFKHMRLRWGGGAHPWDVLGSWDGWWYEQVAVHGYHPESIAAVGGVQHLHENGAAFFPLFPALIRLAMDCTGLGAFGAGMLVSILASFVAAVGIYLVAAKLRGHKAGVVAAVIWAVFPGSGVEWAVYSDSLFVALAAFSCYSVMERRWLTAGVLTFIAGLNRPTAGALIAALGVVGLIALIKRTDGWRPLAAILMSPWGMLAYVAWVGHKMGSWGGYFAIERYPWYHYFDWGKSTWQLTLTTMVGHTPEHNNNHPVANQIALFVLLATPILLVLLLRMRPPLVLVVFTVITIVMVVPNHGLYGNMSRYLLPAFPLYIPLAFAIRRLSWVSLALMLGVAAAASGWYAGYALFQLGVP